MNMEVKGIIKKILIYGGLFICVSLAVGIAIEGMIVYLMAGCAHIASHICVKRGIDKNLPLARQWARY